MASLLASAFFDEALFGPVIHPHRHKYPEDVQIFWSERLRTTWKTPSKRLFVVTTTKEGREEIAGVAIWERQGDDQAANKIASEWVDVGGYFHNKA
jgi:hypothetical protein